MQLLYVMDPMCGWCYGFQPELERFLNSYPTAMVDWVMGGLAPDTTEPMPESLRQTISSYWYQIEERSEVSFNHDFWTLNTPYRSTYLACRAVITAERLKQGSSADMAKAIQSAYYQQAKNPSLEETLVACAASIGLDQTQFQDGLTSKETETMFQQHLAISQQFQVTGFPALFYINEEKLVYPLALGFCKAKDLEARMSQILNKI